MLVVSHDRYFLDNVTNRTLELYHGTVESYPGNFSQYRRQKAERLEVQRRTYEKQQEEIAKMEDFIRRNHYGQNATAGRGPPQEAGADRARAAAPRDRRPADGLSRRPRAPATSCCASSGWPRAFPASRCSTTCRSTFSAARGGASSDPTAAARPRCCGACSASCEPDDGRVIFGSRRQGRLLRPAAQRASIRTCRWSMPCGPRTRSSSSSSGATCSPASASPATWSFKKSAA